jgi:hypothetical protein
LRQNFRVFSAGPARSVAAARVSIFLATGRKVASTAVAAGSATPAQAAATLEKTMKSQPS